MNKTVGKGPGSRSESESMFQVHLVGTLHFIRAQKSLYQINSQFNVDFDMTKEIRFTCVRLAPMRFTL